MEIIKRENILNSLKIKYVILHVNKTYIKFS